MKRSHRQGTGILVTLALACWAVLAWAPGWAAQTAWRFDCGTEQSPVMQGFKSLTASEQYDKARGYGWETPTAQSLVFPEPVPNPEGKGSYGQDDMYKYFTECRTALTTDGVVSKDDLAFRLDVPDGRYRVRVTVGDMSQAIGSIDVRINGALVAEEMAAWSAGSYRMWDQTPGPWWRTVRAVAEAKDGALCIVLSKNQSNYDKQLAEQEKWENPYAAKWYHAKPIVAKAPYFFIGCPFTRNSIMAIEAIPYRPAPVTGEPDKLQLTAPIDSPALGQAIETFNSGDYAGAAKALANATEPEARTARALVALWLAGRLEIEDEQALVTEAAQTLRKAAKENPEDDSLAEAFSDAEIFLKALDLNVNRGKMGRDSHFFENDKAISWWMAIPEDSPLYWKSQLLLTRAARMLKPYFPTIGTEAEIFKKIEEKFPGNRFVKYHMTKEWAPHGDGSHYNDWPKIDYETKVKDAPDWVRALYPAYMGVTELAEWWIRWRQEPEGSIGGGWGDDVELVGLFGYYGMISRDTSAQCIQGTTKLVDGVWNLSEVDPEAGYCAPMADAEHSAEWTGNTLGLMMQIDFGNPTWIERSMKTGKLMRDLWTDYNKKKMRHFRSNFLGAKEVGTGDQANDAFINYRAISPASSVLRYNGNPAILKLYTELADAWVADAMSTDRGKPRGIIPAQVSFPDAVLGGTNSPNWWTASHPKGTVNYDWWDETTLGGQNYKAYLVDLLMAVYEQTRDEKRLEPLRIEYDLVKKHGYDPASAPASKKKPWKAGDPGATAEPGSEVWTAARLQGTQAWVAAEHAIKGRQGALEMTRTKAEAAESGEKCFKYLKEAWPMCTTEAGPTDRVGFAGVADPFFIYTGGSKGGPLLRASVTYENTTRHFAAAVLGSDGQGMRLLYYSMAPDRREIALLPWALEPGGTYKLRYGKDADGDDKIDGAAEEREFVLPQVGTRVPVDVEPRVTYIIEIEQVKRGRPAGPAPDPGLSADDLSYDAGSGTVSAIVHNVGAEPAKDVTVDFYDGAPKAGGKKIGSQTIDLIEAPNDLEPRTKTVSVPFKIESAPREIWVVVDAADTIKDEITDFNNTAKAMLPRAAKPVVKKKPVASGGGARGGR